MTRLRTTGRAALSIALFMLGFVSLGGSTCAMVAQEHPGISDDPGTNAETMENQETDVTDESDR